MTTATLALETTADTTTSDFTIDSVTTSTPAEDMQQWCAGCAGCGECGL